MTDGQKAAYVIAQSTCAMAEIAAMQARNQAAAAANPSWAPPHDENDFRAVIENYGISHNAVLGCFEQ